jgi:hypothetical protein
VQKCLDNGNIQKKPSYVPNVSFIQDQFTDINNTRFLSETTDAREGLPTVEISFHLKQGFQICSIRGDTKVGQTLYIKLEVKRDERHVVRSSRNYIATKGVSEFGFW